MLTSAQFPSFRPHRLLPGGHVQTLAAVYLPGAPYPYRAVQHRVTMDDGDQVVLHDDCPHTWQPGDRMALLLHGLSGCHQSGYMQRIAGKLHDRGIRSLRMDLRGCGAGVGLARLPYHSGRSDDARAALQFMSELAVDSPATIIGFSLGGNIVLKLLGELGEMSCYGLDSAVAVCPPVDLRACSHNLHRLSNKLYDKHFLHSLLRTAKLREDSLTEEYKTVMSRRPRRLFDFDDVYTAPVCGFGNAENYYTTCSSGQFIPAIRRPTLVLATKDDPMIPAALLDRVHWPSQVDLHVTHGGGHLGFIGRPGVDPDSRWMDWRILDWIVSLENTPTEYATQRAAGFIPVEMRV